MARSAEKQLNILLTGASGFIGRHLLSALLEAGHSVVALARKPPTGDSRPGVRWVRHLMPNDLPPECFAQRPDVLIHLAHQTSGGSPEQLFATNGIGSERIFSACRDHAVSKVVYFSSLSARDDARSLYGQSKRLIEKSLHPKKDLVLRPGLVMGDGGLAERLTQTMRRFRLVPLLFGSRRTVQRIEVADLCLGTVRALELGLSGTLNLAEDPPITVRELYQDLARRAGVRAWLVPVPAGPVLRLLRWLERRGVQLPISSENLLGLEALRAVPSAADLQKLGLLQRAPS